MVTFECRPKSGKEMVDQYWMSFDPTRANQDKRDRETLLSKAQNRVNSASNKLGIATLSITNRVSGNREVEKVEYAIPDLPNTPIEEFLKDTEKKTFF